MYKPGIIIATLLLATITYTQAQDTLLAKTPPLTLQATYVGDNVNNLSGGIKTGSCYLGMATIRLNFDIEKAGLWKGGLFYINAANTHGASPSAELLGDMQVASNIEAGNHTYLQEVWFKQAIGKIEFTLGLQDLNVEFASTENGSLFLNSSFGVLPVISNNIPAPIFPLTALGFTFRWNISDQASWGNALYDGTPIDFENNPYNLSWQLNSGDCLLAVSEFQYHLNWMELPGTYKLGVFSHNHLFEKNLPDSLIQETFGVYSIIDQKIWQRENKSFGLFAQLGYSPSKGSVNDFYWGVGFNYNGVCNNQGTDILGLGIAHERLTNGLDSETAIELTYQYPLSDNLFVQPNLQYIINPAGTGETLENVFAATLRFGLSF